MNPEQQHADDPRKSLRRIWSKAQALQYKLASDIRRREGIDIDQNAGTHIADDTAWTPTSAEVMIRNSAAPPHDYDESTSESEVGWGWDDDNDDWQDDPSQAEPVIEGKSIINAEEVCPIEDAGGVWRTVHRRKVAKRKREVEDQSAGKENRFAGLYEEEDLPTLGADEEEQEDPLEAAPVVVKTPIVNATAVRPIEADGGVRRKARSTQHEAGVLVARDRTGAFVGKDTAEGLFLHSWGESAVATLCCAFIAVVCGDHAELWVAAWKGLLGGCCVLLAVVGSGRGLRFAVGEARIVHRAISASVRVSLIVSGFRGIVAVCRAIIAKFHAIAPLSCVPTCLRRILLCVRSPFGSEGALQLAYDRSLIAETPIVSAAAIRPIEAEGGVRRNVRAAQPEAGVGDARDRTGASFGEDAAQDSLLHDWGESAVATLCCAFIAVVGGDHSELWAAAWKGLLGGCCALLVADWSGRGLGFAFDDAGFMHHAIFTSRRVFQIVPEFSRIVAVRQAISAKFSDGAPRLCVPAGLRCILACVRSLFRPARALQLAYDCSLSLLRGAAYGDHKRDRGGGERVFASIDTSLKVSVVAVLSSTIGGTPCNALDFCALAFFYRERYDDGCDAPPCSFRCKRGVLGGQGPAEKVGPVEGSKGHSSTAGGVRWLRWCVLAVAVVFYGSVSSIGVGSIAYGEESRRNQGGGIGGNEWIRGQGRERENAQIRMPAADTPQLLEPTPEGKPKYFDPKYYPPTASQGPTYGPRRLAFTNPTAHYFPAGPQLGATTNARAATSRSQRKSAGGWFGILGSWGGPAGRIYVGVIYSLLSIILPDTASRKPLKWIKTAKFRETPTLHHVFYMQCGSEDPSLVLEGDWIPGGAPSSLGKSTQVYEYYSRPHTHPPAYASQPRWWDIPDRPGALPLDTSSPVQRLSLGRLDSMPLAYVTDECPVVLTVDVEIGASPRTFAMATAPSCSIRTILRAAEANFSCPGPKGVVQPSIDAFTPKGKLIPCGARIVNHQHIVLRRRAVQGGPQKSYVPPGHVAPTLCPEHNKGMLRKGTNNKQPAYKWCCPDCKFIVTAWDIDATLVLPEAPSEAPPPGRKRPAKMPSPGCKRSASSQASSSVQAQSSQSSVGPVQLSQSSVGPASQLSQSSLGIASEMGRLGWPELTQGDLGDHVEQTAQPARDPSLDMETESETSTLPPVTEAKGEHEELTAHPERDPALEIETASEARTSPPVPEEKGEEASGPSTGAVEARGRGDSAPCTPPRPRRACSWDPPLRKTANLSPGHLRSSPPAEEGGLLTEPQPEVTSGPKQQEAPQAAEAELDEIDLVTCFKQPVPTVREVPRCIRADYVRLKKKALDNLVDAYFAQQEDSRCRSRAWKLVLLTERFLLKRTEKTGKEGRTELQARVRLLQQKQFTSLYARTHESQSNTPQQGQRSAPSPLSEERRLAEAIAIAHAGELSNARKLLERDGLAPRTQATLDFLTDQDRRPSTLTEPLPPEIDSFVAAAPIQLNTQRFLEIVRSSRRGKAAGPSSCRAEHHRALLDDMEAALSLAHVAQILAEGNVPEDIREALAFARLTALKKPNSPTEVRGIATGDILRRQVGRCLAQQYAAAFMRATHPHQFALSTRAGTDALARMVTAICERDPRATVVGLDGVGAYDHVKRASIFRALLQRPELHALIPFTRLFYAHTSSYLYQDTLISQGEGVEQGDALAPAYFSLAITHALQLAAAELKEGEHLFSFLDDVFVVASPARVVDIAACTAALIQEKAGIQPKLGKFFAYNTGGLRPTGVERWGVPDDLERAWRPQGVVILGTPLGSKSFINDFCEKRIKKEQKFLELLGRMQDPQVAFLLLLYCAASRATYLLRNVNPLLVTSPHRLLPPLASDHPAGIVAPPPPPREGNLSYADAHDEAIWRCLCQILRVDPDADGPEAAAQLRAARRVSGLPLTRGGLGLRSAKIIAYPAYWGAWADIIPVVRDRFPALANTLLSDLQSPQSPYQSILAAQMSAAVVKAAISSTDSESEWAVPTWKDIDEGAEPPPPEPESRDEPGAWRHGWQFFATRPLLRDFLRTHVHPALNIKGRARLLSQGGKEGGAWLQALPICPATRCPPTTYQYLLRRRLGLPLPQHVAKCPGKNCKSTPDIFGDHLTSCQKAGNPQRRGKLVEDAWFAVFRESGISFKGGSDKDRQPRVADITPDAMPEGEKSEDKRRVEFVLHDLPGSKGLPTAIDVFMTCAISGKSTVMPRAHCIAGTALAACEKVKRTKKYPEFARSQYIDFLTPGIEVGGRFNNDAHQVINGLVQWKTARVHPLLRRSAALAYTKRWYSIISLATQSAHITTIRNLPVNPALPTVEEPLLADVLILADVPPTPSRIC